MASFGELMNFNAGQAGANLTAAQYHIVGLTAAQVVNISSLAATTVLAGAIGVLQNQPNSGQACNVAYVGESKVVAGGAVSVDVAIATNGSGRAVAAVSGDIMIGRAVTSAGADGDVIRAILYPPQPLYRT